jgi:hypothetical protein
MRGSPIVSSHVLVRNTTLCPTSRLSEHGLLYSRALRITITANYLYQSRLEVSICACVISTNCCSSPYSARGEPQRTLSRAAPTPKT